MEPSALLLFLILWEGGLGAIKIQNKVFNLIPSLNKVCCASFLLHFSSFHYSFFLLTQTSE